MARAALAGSLGVALFLPLLIAPSNAAPMAATQNTVAAPTNSADLDVMFIGAHPDDEAFRLATFGQWGQEHGVKTGVITVTRGEGGGNAIGPEEGPALGLIRENEERLAVGRAAITDVYNLDDVDFFYTVSEPLTQQTWSEESLEKIVRVLRTTTPEVIFTMDPAPSPGNHGNHQESALLALMAYEAAGDPNAFPEQITAEGLAPWEPSRIFGGARGTAGAPGPGCATDYTPTRPTQDVYGVWPGGISKADNKTWAQVEREAARNYASQGWSTWGDTNADPNKLACKFFTQLDARVPFVRGDFSADAGDPRAALWGAVLPRDGALPLGTRLEVDVSDFLVTAENAFEVEILVAAPQGTTLENAVVSLDVPATWGVTGADLNLGTVTDVGKTVRAKVTPSSSAQHNVRYLIGASVSSTTGTGYSNVAVEVVPPVRGTQELLPQVAAFQEWAQDNGYPEMDGFVTPVQTVAIAGSRQVAIDVVNHSDVPRNGSVALSWDNDFFAATPVTTDTYSLAPGASTQVLFTVSNTRPDQVKTSNEGGDYPFTISTSVVGGPSSQLKGNLEIVPALEVAEAATAPVVDGTISAGEYEASFDISRVWEGEKCADGQDCSATAYLTRKGSDLFVAVDMNDDVLGTKLDTTDCKRPWRTDAVEIAIDPRGRSENTATTFKSFVLPATVQGPACFGRDADNHQGGPETAPGMQAVSTLKDNGGAYAGYVVETKIPANLLPDTVDPAHMGLNVMVYDSDTQDKTGQTRIGWSTWGGVQGDPYRWGQVSWPGWTPPVVAVKAPAIPDIALSSFKSPQTIDQAARNGVAIAGKPAANDAASARLAGAWVDGSNVMAAINVTGAGTAFLYVLDDSGNVISSREQALVPGQQLVSLPGSDSHRVLMAYSANLGGSTSTAATVLDAAPVSVVTITAPTAIREGEPVNVKVGVAGGGIVPTGTVSMSIDGTEHAVLDVAGGEVTFDLTGHLKAGKATLTATYSGDAFLGAANASATIEVGKALPKPPAVSELTDANRGGISVPASAKRGETITVTTAQSWAGDEAIVWLYSVPQALSQGPVSAAGQLKATIPATASYGAHRIVVTDASGALKGWANISIVSSTPSTGGNLPVTGAALGAIAIAALALLGAGVGLVAVRGIGRRSSVL